MFDTAIGFEPVPLHDYERVMVQFAFPSRHRELVPASAEFFERGERRPTGTVNHPLQTIGARRLGVTLLPGHLVKAGFAPVYLGYYERKKPGFSGLVVRLKLERGAAPAVNPIELGPLTVANLWGRAEVWRHAEISQLCVNFYDRESLYDSGKRREVWVANGEGREKQPLQPAARMIVRDDSLVLV